MQALTRREDQVAQLVASGRSNRQIADRLTISEQTVKNHIQSIFRKLDLNTRVELTIRVRGKKRRRGVAPLVRKPGAALANSSLSPGKRRAWGGRRERR